MLTVIYGDNWDNWDNHQSGMTWITINLGNPELWSPSIWKWDKIWVNLPHTIDYWLVVTGFHEFHDFPIIYWEGHHPN
jgi:hypothetical protein